MKTILVALALITSISLGCAKYDYTAYEGPALPSSEIATIDSESWHDVKIANVDGKKAINIFVYLFVGTWPTTVYVKPGHHEIVPCFHTPYYDLYNGVLEVEAQAGHAYTIKHRREDLKKVKFWIEEKKQHEQAVEKYPLFGR